MRAVAEIRLTNDDDALQCCCFFHDAVTNLESVGIHYETYDVSTITSYLAAIITFIVEQELTTYTTPLRLH